MPEGKFLRNVQFIRRSELAQKVNHFEEPAGEFLRSVQFLHRSEIFGQRENFYVVYTFYIDPSWHREEIILKYQQDKFAPAGKFLLSVKFLRRSELAPRELIPRCQRDIFAPTEFEIQIWV